MNLSDLLTTLWSALRGNIGGGHDFVVVYTALGAILWAFLLFKIFLQEGIQVASGHGTELPKILVKYLFVAAMFAVWPQASNSIFSAIKTLATMFYPSLNGLLDTMAGSMNVMGGGQQAAVKFAGSRQHSSRHCLQLHYRQSFCGNRNDHPFPVLCPDPDQHRRLTDDPCDESCSWSRLFRTCL